MTDFSFSYPIAKDVEIFSLMKHNIYLYKFDHPSVYLYPNDAHGSYNILNGLFLFYL